MDDLNGVFEQAFEKIATGGAGQILDMLYGTWIHCLNSEVSCSEGTVTILTTLLTFFSHASFFYFSILAIFGLFTIAIKMATEGRIDSAQGPGSARHVLSGLVALLFVQPLGVLKGLSAAQGLLIALSVVSFNFADSLAYFVTDHKARTPFIVGDKGGTSDVMDNMLRSAFCARGLTEFAPELEDSNVRNTMYGFDHLSRPQSIKPLSAFENNRPLIMLGNRGVCGELRFDPSSEKADPFLEPVMTLHKEYLQKIYDTVVIPLSEWSYYDYDYALTALGTYESSEQFANHFYRIADHYSSLKEQYRNDLNQTVFNVLQEQYEGRFDDELTYRTTADGVPYATISQEAFMNHGWIYSAVYDTIIRNTEHEVNSAFSVADNVANFNGNNADEWCKMTAQTSRFKDWFTFGDDTDLEKCEFLKEYKKSELIISSVSSSSSSTADDEGIDGVCSSAKNCTVGAVKEYIGKQLTGSLIDYSVRENRQNTAARIFLEAIGFDSSSSLGLRLEDHEITTSELVAGPIQYTDPLSYISNAGHSLLYGTTFVKAGFVSLAGITSGLNNSALGFIGVGSVAGGALDKIMEQIEPFIDALALMGGTMAYVIPLVPPIMFAVAVFRVFVVQFTGLTAINNLVMQFARPDGAGMQGMPFEKTISMIFTVVLGAPLVVIFYHFGMVMLSIFFAFFGQTFWLASGATALVFDPLSFTFTVLMFLSLSTLLVFMCSKLTLDGPDLSLSFINGALFSNSYDPSSNFGDSASNFQGTIAGSVGSGIGSIVRSGMESRTGGREKAYDKKGDGGSEGKS